MINKAGTSPVWRLIVGDGSAPDGPLAGPGARNMGVDQVLLDSAKADGPPTLRFYRWAPACLSLGRNQPARGRYDGAGREPGVHVVRRPTGGLAVYHDDELTYSVACGSGEIGSPRETYLRVHRAIAGGLASLGAATELAQRGASRARRPRDASGVCFHAPAEGEVLTAAGKLVGSAQRSEARTILQHGSILLGGSQDQASAVGPVAGAAPVATLRALLGRDPDDDELVSAIVAAFARALGIRLAPASLSADEQGRLEEAEAKYRSANWTWRT